MLQVVCKGGVEININPHLTNHQTVTDYLLNVAELSNQTIDDLMGTTLTDKLYGIVYGDTLIEILMYPDTPNGFHRLYGSTIQMVVDEALTILEKERNGTN